MRPMATRRRYRRRLTAAEVILVACGYLSFIFISLMTIAALMGY